MKKLFLNLAYGVVLVSLLTLAYGCSDSTVTPTPASNQINGRITFPNVDTAVVNSLTKDSSYFAVSIFANWPPMGNATKTEKLKLKNESGTWVADYTITTPGDGSYVVTSSWIKVPYTVGKSVFGLGTYHSDTSHAVSQVFSTTGKKATISGGTSVSGINFLSWADTTQKIYKF